jgi:acylphosphatase
VGFRAYAHGLARRLQISGEVWNTRYGAVEMIAYHESEAVISEFINLLRQGPGHVEKIHAIPAPAETVDPDFRVSFTR